MDSYYSKYLKYKAKSAYYKNQLAQNGKSLQHGGNLVGSVASIASAALSGQSNIGLRFGMLYKQFPELMETMMDTFIQNYLVLDAQNTNQDIEKSQNLLSFMNTVDSAKAGNIYRRIVELTFDTNEPENDNQYRQNYDAKPAQVGGFFGSLFGNKEAEQAAQRAAQEAEMLARNPGLRLAIPVVAVMNALNESELRVFADHIVNYVRTNGIAEHIIRQVTPDKIKAIGGGEMLYGYSSETSSNMPDDRPNDRLNDRLNDRPSVVYGAPTPVPQNAIVVPNNQTVMYTQPANVVPNNPTLMYTQPANVVTVPSTPNVVYGPPTNIMTVPTNTSTSWGQQPQNQNRNRNRNPWSSRNQINN